ncbi:hypothetical protein [Microbispora sp. H10670]|nr:hypothetical protein [Microbispora sp. H10670]
MEKTTSSGVIETTDARLAADLVVRSGPPPLKPISAARDTPIF